MSRAGLLASAIGRVFAAVRRHFADPTFYARRYRASVGARDALPPPRQSVTSGQILLVWMWWLHRPRRGGAPPKARPNAIERWVARPAVFIPAVPIGLAIIAATLDVTRDAPLYRQLTVMLGVLAALSGLTGAMSYVGRRWPRTEPVLVALTILLGVAAVLCGISLFGRAAVRGVLMNIGLVTLASLAVSWWKSRPGKGGG